jgi:TM2 domain-containing membrane protein YozV
MPQRDSTTQNRPAARRPWLAAFLALLMPGLGHLYLGQPRRCLAIYLIWFSPPLLLVALAAWRGWNLAAVTLAASGASLLVWLGQLAWAVQLARRMDASYCARRYNRAAV